MAASLPNPFKYLPYLPYLPCPKAESALKNQGTFDFRAALWLPYLPYLPPYLPYLPPVSVLWGLVWAGVDRACPVSEYGRRCFQR